MGTVGILGPRFHFQQLTVDLAVPIPLNTPWDRWERLKIVFIGKSRPNHAKNSQIFLELRNKKLVSRLVSGLVFEIGVEIGVRD